MNKLQIKKILKGDVFNVVLNDDETKKDVIGWLEFLDINDKGTKIIKIKILKDMENVDLKKFLNKTIEIDDLKELIFWDKRKIFYSCNYSNIKIKG